MNIKVFEKKIDTQNVYIWVSIWKMSKKKYADLSIAVGIPDKEVYFWEQNKSDMLPREITGKTGLSGLCAINKALPGIFSWLFSVGVDEISVTASDPGEETKRLRAYRFLGRYGFRKTDDYEYTLTKEKKNAD